MPRASGRLDLILVATSGGPPPTGLALPAAEFFVGGGAARVRLDDPGGPELYANQQGGMRVRCPITGQPNGPALAAAIRRWRAEGERSVLCTCGVEHDLLEMDVQPAMAIGRWAVVVADARGAELSPSARSWATSTLGEWALVLRRVSP